MKLLIGLGNIGTSYQNTRHNIGFMVVDEIAAELGIKVIKKQGQALCGQGLIKGCKVLLVKPQTYMNRSGKAVWELLSYYQDQVEDFLIIHDDLDLDFGRLRFRAGGGSGGHNGLKSITEMLNSSDYSRLKIGIGKPQNHLPVEKYVLNSFLQQEEKFIPQIIDIAVKGIETWIQFGVEKAMNEFNCMAVSVSSEADNV